MKKKVKGKAESYFEQTTKILDSSNKTTLNIRVSKKSTVYLNNSLRSLSYKIIYLLL
jgi:hypothetical protein